MVEGFHDVRFPVDIGLGSRGGPGRRTEVVTLATGYEQRHSRWQHARRRYDASYGVKSLVDLDRVVSFFEAREGRRYAFRWRDPLDHTSTTPGGTLSSTDQNIGIGDGVTTIFQLTKQYGTADYSYTRPIALVDPATLLIAVDGVVTPLDSSIVLDAVRGTLTFSTPPPIGAVLTAGFQYDVPARFDTDQLAVTLQAGHGKIADLPVVEVRI